jgi:hypothetical protein
MAKGGINLGAIGRGGDPLVNEFVEGVLHKHILHDMNNKL